MLAPDPDTDRAVPNSATHAQAKRRKGKREMAIIPAASGNKKARFLLNSIRRTQEGRWFLHLQSEAPCQSADQATPTSTLPC
jgi:hypothetical protein